MGRRKTGARRANRHTEDKTAVNRRLEGSERIERQNIGQRTDRKTEYSRTANGQANGIEEGSERVDRWVDTGQAGRQEGGQIEKWVGHTPVEKAGSRTDQQTGGPGQAAGLCSQVGVRQD